MLLRKLQMQKCTWSYLYTCKHSVNHTSDTIWNTQEQH